MKGDHASAALAAESLQEFLTALASGAPVPGGGAAGALCGAMAAALIAMVGRVTAARDASVKAETTAIVAQADELGEQLVRLATDDMVAYGRVVEARRSGSGPEMERALVRATEVPIMLARRSQDVLTLSEALAPRARKSALSDLAVAGTLAWSALESGAVTARANLAELADAEFVRMTDEELRALLEHGQDTRHRLLETLAARAGR